MAKIVGTAGIDTLTGTNGNDTLDGLGSADTLIGGLGNDIYIIDDFFDRIIEQAGQGTDWVHSAVSYSLPSHVEHARLTAKTGDFNLVGNDEDNTLIGNRGNNILMGGDGADTMIGGAGDDTYYINIFSVDGINWGKNRIGDVIIDSGGKNDTVIALGGLASDDYLYTMQRGLENANFIGMASNMNVTGNTSANIISTGTGDDTLDGGRGADTLSGGDGANTYIVDNKKDVVIDSFIDTLNDTLDTLIVKTKSYTLQSNSYVEIIDLTQSKSGVTFTGSDTANTITGGTKKDVIDGGAGNDTIDGGGGRDILTGGLGADTFLFMETALNKSAVTITDFTLTQGDRLDISNIISYEANTAIANYIEITDKGRDSIVKVNTSAVNEAANWVHIAMLKGITGLTGETVLFQDGHIILQ